MIAVLAVVSTLLVVSAIANLALGGRVARLSKENNKLSASTVQLLTSYEDSLADKVTEEEVIKVVKKNPTLISHTLAREVLKENNNLIPHLTWADIKDKVPKDDLVRILRDGNTGHLWGRVHNQKLFSSLVSRETEYTTISCEICEICGVSHSWRVGIPLTAFHRDSQEAFSTAIGYFDQQGNRVDATDGGPPPCRR